MADRSLDALIDTLEKSLLLLDEFIAESRRPNFASRPRRVEEIERLIDRELIRTYEVLRIITTVVGAKKPKTLSSKEMAEFKRHRDTVVHEPDTAFTRVSAVFYLNFGQSVLKELTQQA